MKIKDMFEHDIDRNINGVIRLIRRMTAVSGKS